MALKSVLLKRVDITVGANRDIAASPTVAAVRATVRDVFLATKRNTAVASVAGLYFNGCSIEKHV
jgi:hypothetical protein